MFKKKKVKISESRKQEILFKIKPLIAKELKISEDRISLETKIKEDLGADPLDAIGIVMTLEEEFNIEILDEDTEKMKTVEDIVVYLAERAK